MATETIKYSDNTRIEWDTETGYAKLISNGKTYEGCKQLYTWSNGLYYNPQPYFYFTKDGNGNVETNPANLTTYWSDHTRYVHLYVDSSISTNGQASGAGNSGTAGKNNYYIHRISADYTSDSYYPFSISTLTGMNAGTTGWITAANFDTYMPKGTFYYSFDANGGQDAPATISRVYGEVGYMPTKIPTRTGYTFLYWTDGVNTFRRGATIAYDYNCTFQAVWQVNTYTITYNSNGGTGDGPTDNVTYGSSYTTRANMFTRTGYTFTGWKDQNGTDWTNDIGKPWTWSYTYNVTLYAQWQANTYTVTYDGNGGIWNDQTTWSETITYNSSYYVWPNFFIRTGYTFLGWSPDPDEVSNAWQNWQGQTWTSWTHPADITLYALWMPNPENPILYYQGTNNIISKLRYRDNVTMKCTNSDSLPDFGNSNGEGSSTYFYIRNGNGDLIQKYTLPFGTASLDIGKISVLPNIEPKSMIIISVTNGVKLYGNGKLVEYSATSSAIPYYINNSGILRIQTGNTDSSWKEGQVYIKIDDGANGWKEASTVYVKTGTADTDWKEST